MITFVSGFGRCGTSLVMQMLAAGGMRCAGAYPAYEPPEVNIAMHGTIDSAFLGAHDGHAIKLLDPQRGALPRLECRVLWLNRNPQEQARSQAKLLRILCGISLNRRDVRAFALSYAKDKPRAIAMLKASGASAITELGFEDILASPLEAAWQIAHFCRDARLDAAAMAAVVRSRSSQCAPDMAMEFDLVNRVDPRPLIGPGVE